MIKQIAVALFVASMAALSGCKAQGSAAAATAGVAGPPPQAIVDIVVVETNSTNNSIAALGNDIDQSGTGLTITAVAVDQVVPPLGAAAASTDGDTVTFTPPANFVGVVTLLYAIADGTGAAAFSQIVVSVLPVASLPVALPDAATVAQDSAATGIAVLPNDLDPAGGGLTLTGVAITASLPAATHTAAISGDQVQFTPAAGFAGIVVATYTVTDINGNSADGVLSILVLPLGLVIGPVPLPDAAVVAQDSGLTDIDVLANDVDPAGGGLTLSGVTVTASVPTAAHTVAIAGNQVRFTPAAGFAGAVVVTYTATDVNGNSADGVLNILVSPLLLELGPVPLPDTAVVAVDSGATDVDVLANDIDPANGGLTVTGATVTASVPLATHTVSIVANQVRFTPAASFVGTVLVTYTATDINGNSADGVLGVVVSPLALTLGPVAIPDTAVVAQDSGATDVNVVANDVDPAGGGLTATGVTVTASVPLATHTVAIVANQVRFTPAASFVGTVLVTYTATDINGNSADGVLGVVVSPLALTLGPVAIPDTAVVAQDSGATDVNVVANDVDPAGGGLTVTGVTVTASVPLATHTVAIVANQVRFTPAAGFAGTVLVTYTATDVNGNSADGVLGVVVSPPALTLGPVAIPDTAVVAQDSGATDVNVVANDVDPAGGGLTLTGATVTTSVPLATHTVAIAANQVRFTPAAGFAGTVLVTYTVTDIDGNSADGVLLVVVSPAPLALGPVAIPDTAVVAQDSGATDVNVLANDVDPAGGGLTVTGVTVTASVPLATHTVAIVANQVRFTPAAGFAGTVLVTYTATDVNGNSADGVLGVVVSPQALALGPVAIPDAAVVAQDSGATDVNVVANDVDPAGGGLTLTGVSVTTSVPAAAHTVAIATNQVRFTPAAGFAGTVLVTYTVTDIDGNSADGALVVVVSPQSLALGPVAIPDAAVVAQDSGATDVNVVANDVNPAGGALTLSAVSVTSTLPSATHTVSIAGNQVRFTPAAGFAGVVVVSYTVTDVNGATSNGLLNITVSPTALVLGPVAAPDVGVASSSAGAQLFDVLANDVDPAGGGLTLSNVSITLAVPAGAGSVAVVSNQVQYTPTALYVGSVLITYTATDVNGNTTNGQLSLTVTP